jgi:hypothetical protein
MMVLYRLAGIGLVCALLSPASAQLLQRADLSLDLALAIANHAGAA